MSAPAYIHQHDLLLRTVQDVLADRETAYPHLVAEGKLSAEAAADGLRIMGAIVADWQRIVDLRSGREPAHPEPVEGRATDTEKRAALAYVHDRAGQKLARIVASIRATLAGTRALRAIDLGLTSRPAIAEAHRRRYEGWAHADFGILLSLERQTWLTEALLWHAERWPLALVTAEIHSALIARDHAPQAVAA